MARDAEINKPLAIGLALGYILLFVVIILRQVQDVRRQLRHPRRRGFRLH